MVKKSLEKKVGDLEKQVVETKGKSETIVTEYENEKIELEKLYDYITNGIEGEKYHFYHWKKQQSQIAYKENI